MAITKAPPETKPDPDQYNRVVSHATIRDIRLVAAKFDVKPAASDNARHEWTFEVSSDLNDWHCDNDKATLSGTFSYVAACVVGKKKLISVNCKYLTIYKLSDVCDEEAGRQFLNRVGKFAAYPYFRAMFASLTQQCGLALPPLPVISDGPRWVVAPSPEKANKVKKPA